jgi:undecaprenyl diphosphate synthase
LGAGPRPARDRRSPRGRERSPRHRARGVACRNRHPHRLRVLGRADNVRVRALGRIEALPTATRIAIETLIRDTASCDGLLLNLALNYGARSELCDAIRALARDVQEGSLGLEAIDDDILGNYLYTAGLPDPDLLIRTGGELRVSNFLLYQIAYAELWSTPERWPDFNAASLDRALADFAGRQRRFGS